MRRRLAYMLGVVAFGIAAYAGTVLATPQSGVTTSTVATSSFDAMNVKARSVPPKWKAHLRTKGTSDLYVIDNKFAAGGTTGWHSHPGPSLIFVVSGSVTNYAGDDPSCTKHVYSAGQGFVDAGGGDVHMLRNETLQPAETVAVQVLPQGAPRKDDVPTAPQPC